MRIDILWNGAQQQVSIEWVWCIFVTILNIRQFVRTVHFNPNLLDLLKLLLYKVSNCGFHSFVNRKWREAFCHKFLLIVSALLMFVYDDSFRRNGANQCAWYMQQRMRHIIPFWLYFNHVAMCLRFKSILYNESRTDTH